MKKTLYANFRDAKLIKVIKVEVNEGEGTADDPVRRVVYLCAIDGKLLAKLGEEKSRLFAGEDEINNFEKKD